MGSRPALPTLFLYLLCAGIFIWFCFIRREERRLNEELKYLAGYFAISFISIITAVIIDFESSPTEPIAADINIEGVFRKLWYVLRPYLICFAFLSGLRLVSVYFRARISTGKSAEDQLAKPPSSR